MTKRFRNSIPPTLLIVFLAVSMLLGTIVMIALSGRTQEIKDSFDQGKQDAQQQLQQEEAPQLEQKETPEVTQPQDEQTLNNSDIFHDLTMLTSLKAGLDEQYHLAISQKADTMDSGWLRDFNTTLRELSSRYRDINPKTEKAKFYISIAIGDLRTLSQEYGNSLQGKDNDINFFSNSFEENITKAQENL